MTDLIRTFSPELEVRSRAQGGDGRTIIGLAVPYNHPQYIDTNLTEEFVEGAFTHQLRAAHRVKFARGHLSQGGSLIGRAMELREDAHGLYGEWRVSNTPLGDETLELVRDGALTDLSIGFRAKSAWERRTQGGVVQRTRADLMEVALVLEGAYGEAALVSGVRAQAECRDNAEKAREILNGLPRFLPLP